MIQETQIEAALPAIETPVKKGSPWSHLGRKLTDEEWMAHKKWRKSNPALRFAKGDRRSDGRIFLKMARKAASGECWVTADAYENDVAYSKAYYLKTYKGELKAQRQARNRVSSKAWRLANKERSAAASERWRQHKYKTCPEYRTKVNQLAKNRRDRIDGKYNARHAAARIDAEYPGGRIIGNKISMKIIYDEAKARSRDRRRRVDVDHIIPLLVGGYHHEKNLQILPRSVNRSKGHNAFWISEQYLDWRDVPGQLWPDHLRDSFLAMLFIFGHPLKTQADDFDY